MANNYTLFSEYLDLHSQAEVDWISHQLELIKVYGKEEFEESAEGQPDKDPDYYGYRFLRDYPDIEEWGADFAGFESMFSDKAALEKRGETEVFGRLWIYAEESGMPEFVAHLVQKFLKQCRPDDYWSLTYAGICDKPRVGEFSGGAVFVTAKSVRWCNGYDFISKCAQAIVQRKRKKGKHGRKTK